MQRALFRARRSGICSSHPAPGSGSPPRGQRTQTSPQHEHLKRLDIVTLFPAMFVGPMSESLLGRAQVSGVIEIRIHNLRDWSEDKRHRKIDDRAFGGGPGMVIQAEPIFKALKSLQASGARLFKK